MQAYALVAAQIIIGVGRCRDQVRFEKDGVVFSNTETLSHQAQK